MTKGHLQFLLSLDDSLVKFINVFYGLSVSHAGRPEVVKNVMAMI